MARSDSSLLFPMYFLVLILVLTQIKALFDLGTNIPNTLSTDPTNRKPAKKQQKINKKNIHFMGLIMWLGKNFLETLKNK